MFFKILAVKTENSGSTSANDECSNPPYKDSGEKKARKKQHGQLTLGQRMVLKETKAASENHFASSADISENLPYGSDVEGGVCVPDEVESMSSTDQLVGISWLTETPALGNVPRISFEDSVVHNTLNKCEKVLAIMQLNFFPTNPSVFNDKAVHNWHQWLEKQRDIWRFSNFNRYLSSTKLPMTLPAPFSERNVPALGNPNTIFVDPAPNDLDEEQEHVTHASGAHGSFSTTQRLEMVRNVVAEEMSSKSNLEGVMEGTYCIYKYEYNGEFNIMLGKVKKICYRMEGGRPTDVTAIEVLQCPPKGAKRDNLYIDISAETMFNLDYYIRVTDTLEPSMVLCYNLHMNDNGTFSKRRKQGKYSQTPYVTAKQEIEKFYNQRKSC